MTLSGLPKVVAEIADRSIISNTPLAGIGIVQGPVQRGKIGEPIFVGNKLDFIRKCGAEYPGVDSRFPTYVMRLLDAGCKLYIIRAGHYTTIADKSTLVGTKATINIAISSNNSVWTAEEIGAGYNGTTITITSAASGDANKKDIVITLQDSDISVTLFDVKRAMSAAEISDFNAALKAKGAGVVLTSIATQIENGVGVLATGAQVVANIVAADYNGSPVAANGWYVADAITDSYRIANIGLQDEDVDVGLASYVIARADMRFLVGTPIGITLDGMEDYRDGTSPYSYTPHNTYFGDMIAADVRINNPTNPNGATIDIQGVIDWFANRLRTDQKEFPWISSAGPENGLIISPSVGIPYNVVSPALAAQADIVYNKGVNFIVNDPTYGPMSYGNRTLLKNPNSLLSKSNVADLCIWFVRNLKPAVRIKQFRPNAPEMWQEIYRRILPIVKKAEQNQGIYPGEGKFWFWQGDQDAGLPQNAKFNTQDDLAAGRYRMRLVFVPIVATEYMGIEITATDANNVKFVVQEKVTV